MKRYVCIHGHFYQPPRENPWLEDIELQDSAYPFHDWNERINTECYRPNALSRILDDQKRIVEIVNNYARISFNFGPTLLSWLQRHDAQTYEAILEADRQSRERFSGHGTALAQAYNHLIMPLASQRDKRTQVIWGIRDFEHRFGRRPEGMWLPETAVDLESLEILAQAGISFTILAPHQAKKVRKIGEERWHEVTGGKIDPKMSYLCRLPSGKTISLFFYDGPVSQEVAFSDLLRSGEEFARRLAGTFSDRDTSQLVHIATDGETYGHHHRFGDMALAYALRFIEEKQLAEPIIYGEFLEKFPPAYEVQIRENTSWSCAHGVERWRDDCGCRIGSGNWTQAWRAPLREAMDWLRDRLAPLYEREMAPMAKDPWQARDEYIEIILDRSADRVDEFLRRQAGREISGQERLKALRLLEMQRQALLMYTSCGWFFDDISGIETTQVLCYAGRALQLAEEAAGAELEEDFAGRLQQAPSNLPKWRNGARIYETMVKSTRIDLIRVAAHHAISSEFSGDQKTHQVYCYRARNRTYDLIPAGRMRLALGRTHILSEITGHEGDFAFAVLHLGGHHLNAGVRKFRNEEAFDAMCRSVRDAFEKSDIPEVIRRMDKHFGTHNYSLWHLFKDEQRKIVEQVMAKTLEEIGNYFQQIYEHHYALIRFLHDIDMPVPKPLAVPVEQVLTSRLRKALGDKHPDLNQLKELAEQVEALAVSLEESALGIVAGRQVGERIEKLSHSPRNLALLLTINESLEILQALPLRLDLWRAQNAFHALCRQVQKEIEAADQGEDTDREWAEQLRRLGEFLQVRVP